MTDYRNGRAQGSHATDKRTLERAISCMFRRRLGLPELIYHGAFSTVRHNPRTPGKACLSLASASGRRRYSAGLTERHTRHSSPYRQRQPLESLHLEDLCADLSPSLHPLLGPAHKTHRASQTSHQPETHPSFTQDRVQCTTHHCMCARCYALNQHMHFTGLGYVNGIKIGASYILCDQPEYAIIQYVNTCL